MNYLVGVFLALAVSVFATVVGFDRGRGFYPVLLIVVASYYGLFAVMGGSARVVLEESAIAGGFLLVAVLGFKGNPWLVVGGLFGHGVFDFFHGGMIANAGLPVWWPMFCMTYDVTAAGYLAWLLCRSTRVVAT